MWLRYIIDFVGACVRWLYGTCWRTMAGKPKYKFSEYMNGPENSDDWFDFAGHKLVNKVVGMIALAFIGWIIVQFRF